MFGHSALRALTVYRTTQIFKLSTKPCEKFLAPFGVLFLCVWWRHDVVAAYLYNILMKLEDLLFSKIADNPQMTEALKAILRRENVFVHGRAGSGKSWFIQNILKEILDHTAYLALTNIAAINIGGQTIYRLIGANVETMHVPVKHWTKYKAAAARKNVKNISTIVIDEVSMLRVDLFEALNERLKELRKSHEPFGGIQIILIGDLYQLPPVVQEWSEDVRDIAFFANYPAWKENCFFFASSTYWELGIKNIEFEKVYRTGEEDFVNALNILREGDFTNMHGALSFLNKSANTGPLPEIITALYPYKKTAELKNESELKKLLPAVAPSISKAEFAPEWEWKDNEAGTNLPAPEVLKLKVGAPVIFIKNDEEKAFFNSYTGRVLEIEEDENKNISAVKVHILNTDKTEWIYKASWYKNKIDDSGAQVPDTEKYYRQFPFQLAWAVTIHKAQGLTLDNIYLDLGRGSFAPGQTYVALSRLRSVKGLFLARDIFPADIKTSKNIKEFIAAPPNLVKW